MRRFSKKRKLMVSALCFGIMIFLFRTDVFAMTGDEFAAFMRKNQAWLVSNNLFLDIAHTIGWALVKGCAILSDLCQSLYSYSLGLIDFTTYEPLQQWIATLKGLFQALFTVSLVFAGTVMMIDHEKKPNFLKSVMVAGISISALGYIMLTLNQGVNAFCQEVAAGESNTSNIINENFYDFKYIDSKYGMANMDISNESNLENYHYPEGSFAVENVRINDVMNYADADGDTKYILSHKLLWQVDASNGTQFYTIQDIYNGFGWNSSGGDDWFNEFYYRYHVNYINIYITLIAYCIVYICVSYKTVRIIYELAITRIMALLYSADVNGLQKTLKILGALKDGYVVLMLSAVCIKVFNFAQLYLNSKAGSNSLVYNIVFLFTAFAVVDGPNLIQQLTGIDAGLQSGFGKIMAAYHVGQAAKNTISRPAQFAWQQRQHRQLLNAMGANGGGRESSGSGGSGGSTSSGRSHGGGSDGNSSQTENSNGMNGGNANLNSSLDHERDKGDAQGSQNAGENQNARSQNLDNGSRDTQNDSKTSQSGGADNDKNSSGDDGQRTGSSNIESDVKNADVNENAQAMKGSPIANDSKDQLKNKMNQMPGNRPSGKSGSAKGNIKRSSGNYKGRAASIGKAPKSVSRSSSLKPASSSPKINSVRKNNIGSEKAKDGENIQRNINKSADSRGSFTEKADISRSSVNENDVSGIRNAMEDIGKKSNLSGSDKKGD